VWEIRQHVAMGENSRYHAKGDKVTMLQFLKPVVQCSSSTVKGKDLSMERKMRQETYPFKPLVETITTSRTCSLDIPRPLSQPMQTQFVGDFCCVHCIWQVLLVRKHKKEGVAQLVLIQHALELLTRFGHTFTIVRVYDENDTLRVLEVCEEQSESR
jgi:hypothetical protein